MSEPVTSAEVEDVLSSIRRLVSEDKRPKQASGSAPTRDQDDASAGAVKGANKAPAPEDEATVSSGDFTPHTPGSVRSAMQIPSPENRPSESRSETPKERPFFTSRKVMNPPSVAPVEPPADRLVLTPALRVATSDGQDRPLPSTDAATSTSPAVSPYDYDMLHDDPADLHDDDYGATTSVETAQTERAATTATDDARNANLMPDMGADHAFDAARFTPASTKLAEGKLSDKVAALETAIGQITDNWEPDSPGDDDYSGTEDPAMVWEDDVEAEAEAAPEETGADRAPEPEPAFRIEEQVRRFADSGSRPPEPVAPPAEAPSDAANGLGVEDGFLDEEALRDLVTEIVRAELQGALGERITRNVRKLVRREIHRAMTAQDLE